MKLIWVEVFILNGSEKDRLQNVKILQANFSIEHKIIL